MTHNFQVAIRSVLDVECNHVSFQTISTAFGAGCNVFRIKPPKKIVFHANLLFQRLAAFWSSGPLTGSAAG